MCAGMTGGAPKDRNKPRKAGEMSYNECMAEWRRMQAQQKAELQEKIDAKREMIAELFSQKPLINIEKVVQLQNKIIQNIEKLPPIIKAPAKFVLNIVHSAINIVIRTVNTIHNFISNIGQNIFKMVNSAAEKLPMVLSEIKNIISQNLEKFIIKPTKIILTLFIDMGNQNNKNKKEEKNKKKLRKIIEKLTVMIFGEKDADKQD